MSWRIGLSVLALVLAAGCGEGPPNECGGTGALREGDTEVALGDTCGACGDGVYVCAEEGVACLGASPAPSACGGCGIDPGTLGESCGCGGAWECDESGAMVCSAADVTNECGGCAELSERAGVACTTGEGDDGVQRCTGLDAITCVPLDANGCGGTEVLIGTPATPCGSCDRGVWVCDGIDAVSCHDPERGVNACGGCDPLEGAPETSCGICGGAWACAEDGESVACVGDEPNACGGCAALEGAPGETCDDGGTRYCAGPDRLECGPPGGNACGGTTTLEAEVGAACGDCDDGVWICGGPERLVCRGASALNACGGCGFLPGEVGTSCAPLGTWQCVGSDLACTYRDDANACGGSEPLEGAPGDACGACDLGRLSCDGFDALTCVGGEDERGLSWPDADGDGFGDASAEPMMDCELVGRVRNADDCDDTSAASGPGAAELCDGSDNDCDGRVDEDPADGMDFFVDMDGDGFGHPARVVRGCAGAEGLVTEGGDCNDGSVEFYPGAPEDDCTDDRDLNCDGTTAFVDMDGDGYAACVDCDDDPLRNPGVAERCDMVDNDCDGVTDEGPLVGAPQWYADTDGDGYGDDAVVVSACSQPAGHVPVDGDCDDSRPDVSRGAPEVCGGVDEDCDGAVDEGGASDATAYYLDGDGDGFGLDATAQTSCTPIAGRVTAGGDCNDGNAAIHPHTAATPRADVCDFVDNDCDGLVDGPSQVNPTTWYADDDGDGFGDPGDAVDACEPAVASAAPMGRVLMDGDCNDGNPLQYVGATEVIGDGIDQDCDTREECYVDGDRDGSGTLATVLSPDLACRTEDGEAVDGLSLDCDDADPTISPTAIEVVGDEIDQNCDGSELCFRDADSDGFLAIDPPPEGRYSGSPDRFCWHEGLAPAGAPMTDCDDSRFLVNPSRPDSVLTPDDENCDGYRFDAAVVRAVDPAGGSDGPGCGAPSAPCATVGANPAESEIVIRAGTLTESLTLGDHVLMGGFGPGFTGDPIGTTTVRHAAAAAQSATVEIDGDATLVALEVFGRDDPSVRDPGSIFAPPSVAIELSRGSLAFLRGRVIAGTGAPGDASYPGGGAAYGIRDRDGTTLVVEESEIVLGRGGDGVGGGEGGPSVGVAARTAMVSVDTATTFTRGSSLGGAPGPSPVTCSSTIPIVGLRCQDTRLGQTGRVEDVFLAESRDWLATGADRETTSFALSDGRRSVYNRMVVDSESIAGMELACRQWFDAHPVVLDSPEEEIALARWLVGVNYDGAGRVRTGLVDLEQDGSFAYTTGEAAPYTAWAPGEPAPQVDDQCAVYHPFWRRQNQAWCSGDMVFTGVVCETDEASCVAPGQVCGPGDVPRTCQLDADARLGCFPDASYVAGRDSSPPDAAYLRAPGGGSVYELLRVDGNGDAAFALCAGWGGHPVDIDDAAEEALVAALVDSHPTLYRSWTGMRRNGAGTDWVDSSGSPQPYQLFTPNTRETDGLGAAMLLHHAGTMGATPDDATLDSSEWRTGPAYDDAIPLVCEVELN